jgi:predicted nucleic acid-binding protein
LSKPLIFDTGALVALFNKNEASIAELIEAHIHLNPHSARFVYQPCLVELLYKLVKKEKLLTPAQVKINLDHYGIEIYPLPIENSVAINSAYFSLTYKTVFDYADFYMCSAALRFPQSEILTVDRQDLPNALAEAMRNFSNNAEHFSQLVPFKKKV